MGVILLMSDSRFLRTAAREKNLQFNYEEIRTELFRKGIHIMVALVPAAAAINLLITQILLAAAVILYSVCETYRINGRTIILISGITASAARKRDDGRFVLGPVTLAVGALLALMLYPSSAAAVAIYALAFGDSAASLMGKLFGRITLPGLGDKTFEGSFACLTAVFASTFLVFPNVRGAFAVAVTAALIELIPIKDLDNLLIPVGTGLAAVILLV